MAVRAPARRGVRGTPVSSQNFVRFHSVVRVASGAISDEFVGTAYVSGTMPVVRKGIEDLEPKALCLQAPLHELGQVIRS